METTPHRNRLPAEPNFEAEMIERAMRGDAEAFGYLYSRYLQRVYKFALFRVSDPLEAEDLTETIFLKAWEGLAEYNNISGLPFTAWLFRIAGNTVIDYYRTRHPHEELDDYIPAKDTEEPEHVVMTTDEAARLVEAIQSLPPADQELLHLRFVEELEHADVGTIIGKTVGATRVRQHRALAALGDLLKDK